MFIYRKVPISRPPTPPYIPFDIGGSRQHPVPASHPFVERFEGTVNGAQKKRFYLALQGEARFHFCLEFIPKYGKPFMDAKKAGIEYLPDLEV